ncbi:glycosyltransferase [Pedobacter sp. LMG 31464]|uniref:Glycosyltransferase n=1 Tax=Pedobacter planticolens TaxID=2679964 RepID=A0A923IW84_9SPHI|nr:glycosyltransferase family 4 protein [Pedobacter planticolens]MBB2145919.1 glycosyltransferase [Pedobacter planticolens]
MERILIVNSIYKPEPGVSAQIAEALTVELDQLGYFVTILAPFPSRPKGYKFDFKYTKHKTHIEKIGNSSNLIRLPSYIYSGSNPILRLIEGISFGLACYRYIRRNSHTLDKVYMNTWPIFGQYGVAKACMFEKKPYIVHIQDVYPESFTNKLPNFLKKITHTLLFKIEKFVVQNASQVVVISETMKKLIMSTRKIKEEKIQVVINWQDSSQFSLNEKQPKSDKFTFMYLGNIGTVAGIPFLLKSFASSNLMAKLIIAGSGSQKSDCIAYAKSFPKVDIEFQEVPDGKVPEIQAQADVFLLPIIKNGASSSVPSKLPSYMFSGKPIIACVDHNSETEKCIKSANCGWVSEPEDVQQLVAILRKVVELPPSDLDILGANALRFGQKYFSKEVNLNKLINLITK